MLGNGFDVREDVGGNRITTFGGRNGEQAASFTVMIDDWKRVSDVFRMTILEILFVVILA